MVILLVKRVSCCYHPLYYALFVGFDISRGWNPQTGYCPRIPRAFRAEIYRLCDRLKSPNLLCRVGIAHIIFNSQEV